VGLAAAGALATTLWLAVISVIDAPPPASTLRPLAFSTLVLDRHGALLRPFTTEGGRWRLPVTLDAVDPRFLDMLKAYEDRRFETHPGVDVRAIVRATGQAVLNGRIVSGASTLTMQTVRLSSGRRTRTIGRKLDEIVAALRLERHVGKDAILTRYLNLAPYGGNLEGVRAASLAWFGREPRRLTVAEAALLIALPQSPEARRPDRHPEAARRARDRVLDRLADRNVLTAKEAAIARATPVPTTRRPVPLHAPHLARRLVADAPAIAVHHLTLERDLQAALENLAKRHAARVNPDVSAAIVVADHRSGELLAHVGAADFLSVRRAGHVDMAAAVRSPGSALKPFIYGLAFEMGLARPATIVVDAPTRFGTYEPDNFDDTFHGEVTVAEALQRSLNVPAVALLEAVGPVRLAVRLKDAGAALALPRAEAPSLAIGLGGLGLSLLDLTQLYAGLARGGTAMPLRMTAAADPAKAPAGALLLETAAAGHVTRILQGTPPPVDAPRGAIGYKTGTSYGHRDAFAVGYDGRHVIGVWIGRPDGAPVPSLTGWLDAAPLLFDAFARLSPRRTPMPALPAVTPTAALPPPLQRFDGPHRRGIRISDRSALRIAHPAAGSVIDLDFEAGSAQPLAVRVLGGRDLTYLVNGRSVAVNRFRTPAQLPIEAPGSVHLTVVAPDGASDSVRVTVE